VTASLASPPPHRNLDGTVQLTRQVVGRRTVLAAVGEIDISTAPALSAEIEAALASGALELWIDLTRTTFMDSSGLHALLTANRRLYELNRRLAVISPAGCVRRLFDLAGVSGRLPLYDDRAAAHRAS